MFEDGYFLLFSDFVEIVHVELSNERWELFVFEVFGEDLVFEKLLVFYNECISLFGPFYDCVVYTVLEDAVGFYDEVGYLWLFLLH